MKTLMDKITNCDAKSRYRQIISYKNAALLILLVAALGFLSQGAWIHAKAVLAQWLIQVAWEESRQSPAKPWPWADTWPDARLSVERLGVDLIALRGIEGNSLAFGPGIIPVDKNYGEDGAKIIAGHNDTHFSFLKNLRLNDLIFLQDRNGSIENYRVSTIRVVDSSKEDVELSPEEDLLLITCYPFNTVMLRGPMRYVVSASRVAQSRVLNVGPQHKVRIF